MFVIENTWRNLSNQNVFFLTRKKRVILHEVFKHTNTSYMPQKISLK